MGSSGPQRTHQPHGSEGVGSDASLPANARCREDAAPPTLTPATQVLFPTADTVNALEKLNKASPTRALVVVNKQWNITRGANIISDFGIGPWRARKEKFVGQLEDVRARSRPSAALCDPAAHLRPPMNQGGALI
jgi:hypothetical protein